MLNKISIQLVIFALSTQTAVAKGLEELSNKAPAEQEESKDSEAATDEKQADTQQEVVETKEEKAAPRPEKIKGKLSIETSFGWVSAKMSEGDWKSAGMSDITLSYFIKKHADKFDLFGTYRFAPMDMAGNVDNQSYRGVAEIHNFGGRAHYTASDKLRYLGSAELGYAMVSLDSLDDQPVEDKHRKNSVVVTAGGGADWKALGDYDLAVGPRLYATFGNISAFQLSAAASLKF